MKYQLLKSEGATTYSAEDSCTHDVPRKRPATLSEWLPLLLSSMVNIWFVYSLARSKGKNCSSTSAFGESAFLLGFCFNAETSQARLTPELSIPWVHRTDYGSGNLSQASLLWEAIDFDSGIVALEQEMTRSKGIPDSQPFPWDTSKGLYLLNGYHSLHCLKSIHLSVSEWNLGAPQTYPLAHITHCLDNLRLEVMCQADDTPRWSSNDKKPENGIGQHRQCRDWGKLASWARDHTACYRYLNESANDLNQLERFKFCPPDSPYMPRVRGYFGVGEDWVP